MLKPKKIKMTRAKKSGIPTKMGIYDNQLFQRRELWSLDEHGCLFLEASYSMKNLNAQNNPIYPWGTFGDIE